MATNQFYEFATSSAAYVETLPDYIADVERTAGQQSGVARAELNNRALRQGSAMAAASGSFMSDRFIRRITSTRIRPACLASGRGPRYRGVFCSAHRLLIRLPALAVRRLMPSRWLSCLRTRIPVVQRPQVDIRTPRRRPPLGPTLTRSP